MEKFTNITEIVEKQRLGFNVPRQVDVAYTKLKSIEDDFIMSAYPNPISPVYSSKFCHLAKHEHLLISGNEDGKIILFDTNKPLRSASKDSISIQGHYNAIFDLAWVNQDTGFLSASGDHSAVLWHITEGSIKSVHQFTGHSQSVKLVTCKPDDTNVFATGGRDGSLIIWDKRMPACGDLIEPYKVIKHSHEAHGFFTAKRSVSLTNSITGVIFQDEDNLISCSAGDGLIKIWDMRKTYCVKRRLPQAKHILQYSGLGKKGFSYLAISPCRLRLYANCIDDYIYCYNIGTYEDKPVAQYGGFYRGTSYYIKNSVSPDGRYIATGGSDGIAYIWSVANQSAPLVSLSGHVAEVTCIDWCKAGLLKMATCSDDATVRVWRLHPKEMTCNDPTIKGWANKIVLPPKDNQLETLPRKKRKCYASHHIKTPPKLILEQNENLSPEIRQAEKKMCHGSLDLSSLTGDLPNFVLDGTSPHNHRCTYTPKQRESDWLSKLKARASESSPKDYKSPQQVGSRRRSATGNANSVCGSLLKFFKVSARSNTCDQNN